MKKYLAAVAAALVMAATVVIPWEGKRNAAYQDHIGVWTICYGHTGKAVIKGLRASDAQCDIWLRDDLKIAYATTMKCVPGEIPVSVRAGFTSFAFNVGPGGKGVKDGMCMLKSGKTPTHVILLNSGQYAKACDAMLKWSNAGGKFSKGVHNRRLSEVEMCKADL